MIVLRRVLALLFICAAVVPAASAQTIPRVELVSDLLEQLTAAATEDCLECGVRPSAPAGGEQRASLFEHPQTPARPARVDYELALPAAKDGSLILFAFSIAIADGTKWDAGADGVRFQVAVDGEVLFTEEAKQNRWRDAAVDLTAHAGRRIRLSLLTHAIGNTSYDWAVWGNPRVILFGGGPAPADLRLASGIGAIAVNPDPGIETVVRLKPIGNGDPMVWRLPAAADRARRWFAFDFSFPGSSGVEISWEPASALNPDQTRLGAYPARPRLVRLSPAQAITRAGESAGINAEVRNEGRGQLDPGTARVELQWGANADSGAPIEPLSIPALAPGESWVGHWSWVAPGAPGALPVRAGLSSTTGAFAPQVRTNSIVVHSSARDATLITGSFELEWFGMGTGQNYAQLRRDKEGPCVAVWSPLMRVVIESTNGPVEWNVPLDAPSHNAGTRTWLLRAQGAQDPLGGIWDARLELREDDRRPWVHVRSELTPRQDSDLRAFWGPNLYVGDGTSRNRKAWGLFPGLEYLWGPERSSNPRDFAPPLNDRRTPHPGKSTIPVMAVSTSAADWSPPGKPGRFYAPDSLKDSIAPGGADRQLAIGNRRSDLTLALWWDPLQKWSGQHAFPSPRFASPNFDEGMENHRIGLFVPSVSDLVAENGEISKEPFRVKAGEKISLECTLMVTPEPVLSAVREWLRDQGGLPAPNPWPRSFQEELDVCRRGFLQTLWDEKTGKWRHCIDWASSHAPGFAALLWMDSQVAANDEAREQSRGRVERAAADMLRDGGPALFTSQANCHIMQWEFPFLYGCLPEAIAGLEGQILQLIQTQRPDGGWVYEPSGPEQSGLGQAGDSVLGTCANRASTLLRYARITGDTNAAVAGLRALEFMERFRVPRGGQTWECPMYEPDILAAAYAIKANVDGYRITGDQRWLHDAVYWAETGVPFVYLWSLPGKPMMLGATIPVFGSTFYSHSWLATPVQWCGLVYSYHVWHLAGELERLAPAQGQSPLPLALNFSPSDWKRLVELITVSGMYQQFAEGPRIGAYPDSISEFEKRNPAFINPEDILLNVLTLKGHDPDVKTERLKTDAGEVVISSGADVREARVTRDGARFQLSFFKGESSHTLVAGLKPREVRVNGTRLPESPTPVRREPGWWWDQARRRLFLTVRHDARETIEIEIDRRGL